MQDTKGCSFRVPLNSQGPDWLEMTGTTQRALCVSDSRIHWVGEPFGGWRYRGSCGNVRFV